MAVIQLALYKGPPKQDLVHTVTHYGIRIKTVSKWSHAELVIDGVCHSSSARDKGVRSKEIDLNSGKWDVYTVNADVVKALEWFSLHEGKHYDYRGVVRYILPFVGQNKDEYFCFEAVALMLGMPKAHKLTANDLHSWALDNLA